MRIFEVNLFGTATRLRQKVSAAPRQTAGFPRKGLRNAAKLCIPLSSNPANLLKRRVFIHTWRIPLSSKTRYHVRRWKQPAAARFGIEV
jgi:hypothetical protein